MPRQRLAKVLGINRQTARYNDRGGYNPSQESVFGVSELFGLPIEAVFSREPKKINQEERFG